MVSGRGNVLRGNAAARCTGSGFKLGGDDHVLDANRASATGASGFLLEGGLNMNNALRNNRSEWSNGAGFALLAAGGTVLTGNVASGGRLGLCDQGTSTDVSRGNSFGTTAAACAIKD